MPAPEPAISGKAQLAEDRARFSVPALHADILARIVLGNKVIDHERVRGIRQDPIEALAIYEVSSDLIQTVWFFQGESPPRTRDGVITCSPIELGGGSALV